jgi:hypothetical protein
MAYSGMLRRVALEDAILYSHRRENLKSYLQNMICSGTTEIKRWIQE